MFLFGLGTSESDADERYLSVIGVELKDDSSWLF